MTKTPEINFQGIFRAQLVQRLGAYPRSSGS